MVVRVLKKRSIQDIILETKNIIFLDIDGVLNSLKWRESFITKVMRKNNEKLEIRLLDPLPIYLLLKLIRKTSSRIVMSSAWRNGKKTYFWRLFYDMGFRFKLSDFIGETPDLHDKKRGYEIQKWIQDNNYTGKYIILDDDNDFLKGQLEFLIRTNHKYGFSINDYYKALNLLGDKK